MFDFFTAYSLLHAQVYGRAPCTREQWNEWVKQPHQPAPSMSDIEFDTAKEREGDAQ